jgi:hypothetical protein
VLLAADNGTEIAYIALAGTLAVPVITGVFGVVMANRNRQTNADTTTKIDRSTRRVAAFEDMYLELQRKSRALEYFEERCDRQEAQILAQAARIRELEIAAAGDQPQETP